MSRCVPLLLLVLVLVGCGLPRRAAYPDWRQPDPASLTEDLPATVVLLQDRPLDPPLLERLASVERLLLVIPGISSGVLPESLRWSESVRSATGADAVVFYDWLPGSRGRGVMNAGSTQAGGEHLAAVLAALIQQRGSQPVLDVLAHSGGSVILRKAARTLDALEQACRFRHVLFLGTPIAPDAAMGPLLGRCDRLCNVFSAFDKIVRNLSDHEVGIDILGDAPPHWNRRFDRSLGGLIVRHGTYLQDGPEMRLNWALFLRDGDWPQPTPLPDRRMISLEQLHRHAWWLSGHTVGDRSETTWMARDLIEDGTAEEASYGVLMAGLCRDHLAWPFIDRRLRDPATPAFLRREIYRYLANLRDPRFLPLLGYCEVHDPANAEVVSDVLRELKRARVAPP